MREQAADAAEGEGAADISAIENSWRLVRVIHPHQPGRSVGHLRRSRRDRMVRAVDELEVCRRESMLSRSVGALPRDKLAVSDLHQVGTHSR